MPRGHLALVLHAHLPFVRHPEHQDHLEERWLFEAMAGCYLPLVQALTRLANEGVAARLTVSLSPTLVAMLRDELLCARFEAHLGKVDRLVERELSRTAGDPWYGPVARHLAVRQVGLWETWWRIRRDLVGAFAALEREGLVELWTCGATHAFLPALVHHPAMIHAQVAAAVETHARATGRRPRGIWLPECGWTPGIDRVLTRHGLAYTALETHALLHATPRPRTATAAPVITHAGVCCFGRDVESSRQVWSRDEGYPGDPAYREFYRDAGYDLPLDDVREFLAADGTRQATGLKYHRITDRDGSPKLAYEPSIARERAREHAGNFVHNREQQVRWLAEHMDPRTAPVVLAPYDAELYGHWWFEGVDFLEDVFRSLARSSGDVTPVTAGEYLAKYSTHDLAEPEPSSWGAGGYSGVWLDPSTSWMLRHVDRVCREMTDIARTHRTVDGAKGRCARQAAREAMLLVGSDWAFLIKTGGAPHYAKRRFEAHLERFHKLAEMLRAGAIDEAYVVDLESRDNLFASLNLDWFLTGEHT
jgi:1,4-alpha-glucan branching enzyme